VCALVILLTRLCQWFRVIQVVHWFVERGCKDMELCLALTAAASSSRVEVAAFLLSHVPHHVLQTLSAEILKVLLGLKIPMGFKVYRCYCSAPVL